MTGRRIEGLLGLGNYDNDDDFATRIHESLPPGWEVLQADPHSVSFLLPGDVRIDIDGLPEGGYP